MVSPNKSAAQGDKMNQRIGFFTEFAGKGDCQNKDSIRGGSCKHLEHTPAVHFDGEAVKESDSVRSIYEDRTN
jgi:hypothetical protein